MPLDRRTFSTLDTDTAPESVTNGRARRMLNMQPERGYGTSVRGNVALPAISYPEGRNETVATAELPGTSGGIAWLTWNSNGNHSACRQLPGQAPELLLSWPGLNLPAPSPDLYVPLVVVDTFLLYLDADGEMRNLPMPRLAAGEFPPARLAAEPWGLHVVKVPPTQPLAPKRVQLTGSDPILASKLVAQKAWQFSYRLQYVDGETTVLAPYSQWLDVLELPSDATNNAITMDLPRVPVGVREVDILVRTPGDVGWRIADTLRRTSAGTLPATFTFYGLTKGATVQGDDASRLFEALWPSKAMTAARNRLWYGHPRIGYVTPEPAFVAEVTTGNLSSTPGAYYTLIVTVTAPTGEGEVPAPTDQVSLYGPVSGTYPDPGSTYRGIAVYQNMGGVVVYQRVGPVLTYAEAFQTPVTDETNRRVEVGQVQYVSDAGGDTPADFTDARTFHENSTYRVVVQFYDALGRTAGCSAARTVTIPARPAGDQNYRSIRATLTTTDPAALNLEIPPWATEYQFLVARNDRTIYFIQGEAADAFAFLGDVTKIRDDNSRIQYPSLVDVTKNAHEKVRLDIGNWPATGQGYQWRPGDMVRLLHEQKEYLITNQVGDFIEYASTDWPRQSLINGNSVPLIEIYTPNVTPSSVYYERGPRLPILRRTVGGVEQRSYGSPSVLLEGDCYLVPISFPTIVKSNEYLEDPSNNKSYQSAKAPTLVESMVPPFRLAPSSTITKTEYDKRSKGGFFSNLFSHPIDFLVPPLAIFDSIKYLATDEPDTPANTSFAQADTVNRPAANLIWLDMSYGGRPGIQLPLALQQVELPTSVGFSAARLAGTLLNGLSVWQASDQRELAREQGSVQVLAPANDVQSEDQVLVAICREGVVSLGVEVGRARQADGGTLTVDTSAVIGYINSQRNHLGTRHPRSVTSRNGRLHWWSADQAEVCRYAQDGVNPLNTHGECRTLGRELAEAFGTATVTAGYDAYVEEYVLTFRTAETSRTVRYSERAGGFVGDTALRPEALVGTINKRLVAFREGQPWETSTSAPRSNFFGQQYPHEVSAWANAYGSLEKTWLALEIESGEERWEMVRAETPAGRHTRLPLTRLAWLDQRWQGALLLDATSPGFSGTDRERRALYEGVPMQGLALLVTLRCVDPSPTVQLRALAVEYFINGGQSPAQ